MCDCICDTTDIHTTIHTKMTKYKIENYLEWKALENKGFLGFAGFSTRILKVRCWEILQGTSWGNIGFKPFPPSIQGFFDRISLIEGGKQKFCGQAKYDNN